MDREELPEEVRQEKIEEIIRLWNTNFERQNAFEERLAKARTCSVPLPIEINWQYVEERIKFSRIILEIIQKSGKMDNLDTADLKRLNDTIDVLKDFALVDVPVGLLVVAEEAMAKK